MTINGVGSITAQKLLKEFGSVKKIKEAEKDELLAIAGRAVGNKIYDFFHAESK